MGGVDFQTFTEYQRCQTIYFQRCREEKFLDAMKHCSERWDADWPDETTPGDKHNSLYLIFVKGEKNESYKDIVERLIKCVQDAERMTK